MRAIIDTDLKTLLILGDVSEDQIKSFVLAHDLEAFEVKREWPYDQPHCEDILKVMRYSITYERVEKECRDTKHVFTYNPFNSKPNGLIFTETKDGDLMESIVNSGVLKFGANGEQYLNTDAPIDDLINHIESNTYERFKRGMPNEI